MGKHYCTLGYFNPVLSLSKWYWYSDAISRWRGREKSARRIFIGKVGVCCFVAEVREQHRSANVCAN